MKIYKKYLIKNLFKPLVVSLLTLTIMIWGTRVVRYMSYISEDGANFFSFISLTLLILPSLVLMIFPLTIFLTTVLTYNKMIENREIVILKNCGIKKIQLLNPLLILSIIICVLSYGFSLYGAYRSNLAIRHFKQDIESNMSLAVIKEGVFSKFRNVVMYADKKDDNMIYNMMIYNSSNKSGEKNIILQAERAVIDGNIINLYNGNFQQFDNNYRNAPEIFFFDEYNVMFDEFMEPKDQKIMKPDSISTIELFKVISNYENYSHIFPNKNKLIYEINYRLFLPILSIVMALLSGSIMLEGSFNRINSSRLMILTSIISILVYVILLSLYQKVADGVLFLYILYSLIAIIVGVSIYLIREKKTI